MEINSNKEYLKQIKNNLPYLKALLKEGVPSKEKLIYIDNIIANLQQLVEDKLNDYN